MFCAGILCRKEGGDRCLPFRGQLIPLRTVSDTKEFHRRATYEDLDFESHSIETRCGRPIPANDCQPDSAG
ncbi:MAG: hypothetical protein ACK6EB_18265, partial [Planctomyces sp.]